MKTVGGSFEEFVWKNSRFRSEIAEFAFRNVKRGKLGIKRVGALYEVFGWRDERALTTAFRHSLDEICGIVFQYPKKTVKMRLAIKKMRDEEIPEAKRELGTFEREIEKERKRMKFSAAVNWVIATAIASAIVLVPWF